MTVRRNSLVENPIVRGVGALGGTLAIVFVLGEIPPRNAVPVTILFTGMIAHSVGDELWDLPRGSSNCAFGVVALLAGTYWLVVSGSSASALVVTIAGSWFVFDGATMARYGRNDVSNDTEDSFGGYAEAMLTLQARIYVHRALENASEPRTASALATECDLTESRVGAALEHLQKAGYVETVEDGYRAVPSRWGPLAPIVRFAAWVPKRIVRPVRRLR